MRVSLFELSSRHTNLVNPLSLLQLILPQLHLTH